MNYTQALVKARLYRIIGISLLLISLPIFFTSLLKSIYLLTDPLSANSLNQLIKNAVAAAYHLPWFPRFIRVALPR